MSESLPVSSLEAAFFDLDGTLIDTRAANRQAYREAFAVTGVAFDEVAYDATWGRDSRDFLPILIPGAPESTLRGVRTAKAAAYPRHIGAASLNESLVLVATHLATEMPTALVTTAKRSNVEAVLAAHPALSGVFAEIVTGDEVASSKPSPEPYLEALRRLRVDPSRCVAFEDSESGIESARAAGVRAVQVVFHA